jgi:hypothetical protein
MESSAGEDEGAQDGGGQGDGSPAAEANAPEPLPEASVSSEAEAGTVDNDVAVEAHPPDELPNAPGAGLLHTTAQLDFMRAHRTQEPWAAAMARVLDEANSSLGRTPAPPVDFNVPYYYANPEESDAAKACLHEDGVAAYVLALSYQLAETSAERSQYADKAVEILNAWGSVNKSVSGGDGTLLMVYKGVLLLYAADLVMNYEGWTPSARDTFMVWVDGVFAKSASDIKARKNNWGDWGTLGAVASAGLHNDTTGVLIEVERIKQRIETNIDANGEIPEENLRTNSGMWYTFFALTSMTTAAHIARNTTGANLFDFQAPNGRSIRLALDKLFFYCEHPDQWPYPLPDGILGQIQKLLYPCADEVLVPQPDSWPGNLYEGVSDIYQVGAWEDWVTPYRPQRGYHGWLYPTLMRQTP